MKTSVRKKIVKILKSDADLLINWREFYDELDLEIADYIRLNDLYKKGTLTHYELFSEILSIWVADNFELDSDTQVRKLIEVLKNNGSNLVAGQLENEFPILKQTDKKLPIWFEVRKGTKNFVGRDEQLEKLELLFENTDEFVVTITGMGGIGKSELSKNFAKQIAVTDSVDCIWLNGKSKETLKKSIERLAACVKFGLNESWPSAVQFAHLISSISRKIRIPRILVIIDNVDDANTKVLRLISSTPDGVCFFVVTSRNVIVLKDAGTNIKLDTLTDEAAMNLLNKSDIDEPQLEMKKLCFLLGNFPLALQQAAAFIKIQKRTSVKGESYKICDYVDIYERQKRDLLGHELNPIDHEYRQTTLITWNISLDIIKKDKKFGDVAIQLLNTIAYFESDGIHVEFLTLYQNDLLETVPLIITYSLVKVKNDMISIHRLIQEVIRLNLGSDQMEISQLTKIISNIQSLLKPVEQFVGLGGYLFPQYYETSEITEAGSLKNIKNGISHIVSVLKHATKHAQLLDNFKNVFLDTVNNLRHFTLYQLIIELIRATLNQLKEIFASDKDFTLSLESELVYAQCKIDYFNKDTNTKLIELKTIYAQQRATASLTTAHYIADIQRKNRWEAVSRQENADNLRWCREIVALKTEVFGPQHKSTLSTKLLLARNINSLYGDDPEESVKLYKECFQWQMTHLGAEGSGTYTIFNSFVKQLLSTGRLEKAECVVQKYFKNQAD